MTFREPTPEPKTVLVCTLCGLDWRKHLDRAFVNVEVTSNDGYYDEFRREARPVSALDCVALLQVVNQGPPGPVGAMGAAGMDGRDAT